MRVSMTIRTSAVTLGSIPTSLTFMGKDATHAKGCLTLVYAARDELHNEAVMLRDVLIHGRSSGRSSALRFFFSKWALGVHDSALKAAQLTAA
jgi:hypothetical protein